MAFIMGILNTNNSIRSLDGGSLVFVAQPPMLLVDSLCFPSLILLLVQSCSSPMTIVVVVVVETSVCLTCFRFACYEQCQKVVIPLYVLLQNGFPCLQFWIIPNMLDSTTTSTKQEQQQQQNTKKWLSTCTILIKQ